MWRFGKRLIRAGLRVLPAKDALLRLGANLSPSLKGDTTQRLFGAIGAARGSNPPLLLATNLGLGIARPLTVQLPLDAPTNYLFGTAAQYTGERGAVALACELAGDAGAFIDIGAHYGYFSFALAGRYGDRLPIHYFEPNEALFACIENNARRLNLKSMTGHRLGIGSLDGLTRFYLDSEDSSQSSLYPPQRDPGRYKTVEIDVVSFNSFCAGVNFRNLLVKVDVEGAEFEFLAGLGDATERIAWLIIEVLGPAIEAGFIEAAAVRLDMEPYYINDYRLEYAPGSKFRYAPPQYNWLFARQAPEDLARRLSKTRFEVI